MPPFKQHPDILVLEDNSYTDGDDLFIADIHGQLDTMQAIIEKFSHRKYRVIFSGDTIDRGPNSLAVIKYFLQLEKNQAENSPTVYTTAGNHELLCLQAIQEYEQILKLFPFFDKSINFKDWLKSLPIESTKFIFLHANEKNGGQWLMDLVECEIRADKFRCAEGNILYHDDSDVQLVKDFCSTRPFVIHIKESALNPPINAVHADLSILTDAMLLHKAKHNIALTLAERSYITSARPNEIKRCAATRTINSSIVICGHNPLMNNSKSIRAERNHVNIDATHSNGCVLFFSRQAETAFILMVNEQNTNATDMTLLRNACAHINTHFKISSKRLILNELHECINGRQQGVSKLQTARLFIETLLVKNEISLESFKLLILNTLTLGFETSYIPTDYADFIKHLQMTLDLLTQYIGEMSSLTESSGTQTMLLRYSFLSTMPELPVRAKSVDYDSEDSPIPPRQNRAYSL